MSISTEARRDNINDMAVLVALASQVQVAVLEEVLIAKYQFNGGRLFDVRGTRVKGDSYVSTVCLHGTLIDLAAELRAEIHDDIIEKLNVLDDALRVDQTEATNQAAFAYRNQTLAGSARAAINAENRAIRA